MGSVICQSCGAIDDAALDFTLKVEKHAWYLWNLVCIACGETELYTELVPGCLVVTEEYNVLTAYRASDIIGHVSINPGLQRIEIYREFGCAIVTEEWDA